MADSYLAVLARLEARHGANFSAPAGVEHLTRYWGHPRVEVANRTHGAVRRGHISITTGWKPSLMLMSRRGAMGSSDLLTPDDIVTAVIDARGRRHPV